MSDPMNFFCSIYVKILAPIIYRPIKTTPGGAADLFDVARETFIAIRSNRHPARSVRK
jgi:hypothetical protein